MVGIVELMAHRQLLEKTLRGGYGYGGGGSYEYRSPIEDKLVIIKIIS